jgi:hypothetical protein
MKRAILFLVLFIVSMISFKAPVNGRDAYTPILPGNALELKKLAANNEITIAKAVLESIGKPAPYGGGQEGLSIGLRGSRLLNF